MLTALPLVISLLALVQGVVIFLFFVVVVVFLFFLVTSYKESPSPQPCPVCMVYYHPSPPTYNQQNKIALLRNRRLVGSVTKRRHSSLGETAIVRDIPVRA